MYHMTLNTHFVQASVSTQDNGIDFSLQTKKRFVVALSFPLHPTPPADEPDLSYVALKQGGQTIGSVATMPRQLACSLSPLLRLILCLGRSYEDVSGAVYCPRHPCTRPLLTLYILYHWIHRENGGGVVIAPSFPLHPITRVDLPVLLYLALHESRRKVGNVVTPPRQLLFSLSPALYQFSSIERGSEDLSVASYCPIYSFQLPFRRFCSY